MASQGRTTLMYGLSGTPMQNNFQGKAAAAGGEVAAYDMQHMAHGGRELQVGALAGPPPLRPRAAHGPQLLPSWPLVPPGHPLHPLSFLAALHTVLSFFVPGCLNSWSAFRAYYATPMQMGRRTDASHAERKLAATRASKLEEKRCRVMLRRTKDVIADQLPKKTDSVVLCGLTPLQVRALAWWERLKAGREGLALLQVRVGGRTFPDSVECFPPPPQHQERC